VQPCPRRCAVSARCAPPWILLLAADALERVDNYLYQRHFVNGLMSRHTRKQKLFPGRYKLNGLPPVRTVRQFDDVHHRAAVRLSRRAGLLRPRWRETSCGADPRAHALDHRAGMIPSSPTLHS